MTKPYILDEAGANKCDIAIALSGKDTDNLVACQLCKKHFSVPKTVSLVADPNKTDFFNQMGVDSVVCAISAVTGIIQQQAFIDEMANIIPVGKGRVQIVEVQIPNESPVAEKKLWEITLPKESIVGCILRSDSTIIPRGDTRILPGDTLVVITANGQESSSLGKLSLLIGLFVIAPIVVLPWYPEDGIYALSFLIPGGISLILGLLLLFFGKKDTEVPMNWQAQLGRSSLIVLFAWGWGVLIGALPFVLGKQLRFVQAIFEAVSGWTTTGLSAMDVSIVPMIYLFHRSFMQYCGGLGFIMMMIIFISNKQSMNLYSAEGHPDKIMPNIKKTAQSIFIIYNIFLVLGTIAYRIAGMTWFDSICHCMCSLSTGGFSTKLMSIGEYNSLSIEIITIVLMLIGTTNFAALILLAKGKISSFFKVSEVKFMFILLAIFIPPTAFSLAQEVADDTTGFVIAYFVIYIIGTLAMTITADCSLTEAMFDFASSLSTVGLSIGITGPMTNDATLIVEIIGMLLGRLEIFIVIIGFTFGFRRLKEIVFRKSNSIPTKTY